VCCVFPAGIALEEGDKEVGKSADLTTQKRHDKLTTSASTTTLRNKGN